MTTTQSTACASDLGLPAGHWPMELTFEGRTYRRATAKWSRDDLVYVRYLRAGQPPLIVFND